MNIKVATEIEISLLELLLSRVDDWYKHIGAQRFIQYDRDPKEGTKDFLREVISEWKE